MKLLALIAARGGSKRVPGKNIRSLAGKPLIEWSIDVAQGIPDICDVLVSTDDAAIAKIASDAGASVPWLRPEELATDRATSVAVAIHALDWYEREHGPVDGLMLLQPTCPFRRRQTVLRGIALYEEHQRRPVISVAPATSHPLWCFKVEGDTMRPFIDGSGLVTRSQDLPAAYIINGAFYLIAPGDLRARQSFYADDVVPLLTDDPCESMDIDTEWDWELAECMAKNRFSGN